MVPTPRSSTGISRGLIFVRSRDGRRSLSAFPATLAEKTRQMFAKLSKSGTARPSWNPLVPGRMGKSMARKDDEKSYLMGRAKPFGSYNPFSNAGMGAADELRSRENERKFY